MGNSVFRVERYTPSDCKFLDLANILTTFTRFNIYTIQESKAMDIGTAAFWIFLAAVVIVINWRNKHREAMKYEMVRFLIEKNQKLDEKQVVELLKPHRPVISYVAVYWELNRRHKRRQELADCGPLISSSSQLTDVCRWKNPVPNYFD